MPPLTAPDPGVAPPGEPGSWLMQVGGIVGAAALGSAMATAPAALRLEATLGKCSPVGAWPVLFVATLAPMCLAVVGLRRARSGFRALGRSEGMTPVVMLLAWLGSCFGALTLLGALLRARTHHRALGGVVFAFAAFGVALGLALVLARVGSVIRRASPRLRWALAAAGAATLGLAVLQVRHRLGSTAPFSAAEGAKLVDGLAFALSAFIASGHPFAHRRSLALLGPPLAAVILILGVSSWRTCPTLGATLGEQAPMFGWMAHYSAPH
jgi:hypothetical protein